MKKVIIEKKFGNVEIKVRNYHFCYNRLELELEFKGENAKFEFDKKRNLITIWDDKMTDLIKKLVGITNKGRVILTITEGQKNEINNLIEETKAEKQKEVNDKFMKFIKENDKFLLYKRFCNGANISLINNDAEIVSEFENRYKNILKKILVIRIENLEVEIKNTYFTETGEEVSFEITKELFNSLAEREVIQDKEIKICERPLSPEEKEKQRKGMQQCWECGRWFYPKKDDYDAGMPYCGC